MIALKDKIKLIDAPVEDYYSLDNITLQTPKTNYFYGKITEDFVKSYKTDTGLKDIRYLTVRISKNDYILVLGGSDFSNKYVNPVFVINGTYFILQSIKEYKTYSFVDLRLKGADSNKFLNLESHNITNN